MVEECVELLFVADGVVEAECAVGGAGFGVDEGGGAVVGGFDGAVYFFEEVGDDFFAEVGGVFAFGPIAPRGEVVRGGLRDFPAGSGEAVQEAARGGGGGGDGGNGSVHWESPVGVGFDVGDCCVLRGGRPSRG